MIIHEGVERMQPVWERLREIADKAEADSKRVLDDEARRRIAEYREAQLADPLDLLVRIPRPTPWQVEALRFIATGAAEDERTDEWRAFLGRTKPGVPRGSVDDEIEGLGDFIKSSNFSLYSMQLNLLGLAVLADLEDRG